MPEYRNIPLDAACYSKVVVPGKHTLCVTMPEMVRCGVSENTFYDGIRRQRNGEVSCWPHHKEGKTVYLHYQGLKPPYQAMIRKVLMDNLTVEEWYNRNGRITQIEQRLEPYAVLSAADNLFFDKAKYPTGEKLSIEAQTQAREACRWLSMFLHLKCKSDVKAIGYSTVQELYDDAIFLFTNKGIALPTAYCKLRQKIREFEKEGAACCIDKRGQNNKNAAKVYTEEQVALLRSICGRGASYNSRQIAELYNMVAQAKGWDNISRRSALNYLKEYHLIVKAGRDGSEAFRNKISMQIRRRRPTEALSFWSLDGWTVELYYQKDVKDSKGKIIHTYQNRLTAVIVIDAACDYPVGYALADGESVALIRQAVKNAIDHCYDVMGDYYKPYQIQSDHYGIKSMGTIYEDAAKYFTPARVKNAKSKPVERYFKSLNQNYCQFFFGNSNWSGFGITARKESQPNIDVLNSAKRTFPDREGCIRQIEWIISEERKKKQETWLKAWERMPRADRLVMDRETYLFHFGTRTDRPIRIQAGCLEPVIKGVKMAYDTFDLDFRKNPLQSWTVIYDDRDMRSILVTDNTEKQRFLLESVYQQPMTLRDRRPGDAAALAKVDEFNKRELEPYVINTVANDMEIVGQMLDQSPELEGKRTYTMLTDSRGQQKAYLQHASLIKSEEDLATEMEEKISLQVAKAVIKRQKKAEKVAKKQAEIAYESYLRKKLDLNKIRDL